MFTIIQGIDNSFVFTIKENGTTLPLEILPTYTFHFFLRQLSDSTRISIANLTCISNPEGKVELTIPASTTTTLVSEQGPKEDRYYLKPTYELIIDCDTGCSANGKFIVRVPDVRVAPGVLGDVPAAFCVPADSCMPDVFASS